MPVISATVDTEPAGGSSRCNVMRCSPCTSIAGLNDPMLPNTPVTSASVTTCDGSARWVMFIEFSVVNSRSSTPQPTPSAYRIESFEVHDDVAGADGEPTASGVTGLRWGP